MTPPDRDLIDSLYHRLFPPPAIEAWRQMMQEFVAAALKGSAHGPSGEDPPMDGSDPFLRGVAAARRGVGTRLEGKCGSVTPPNALMRQFVGWLSGDIPELHSVEVPRLADSLERFLAATLKEGEAHDRRPGPPADNAAEGGAFVTTPTWVFIEDHGRKGKAVIVLTRAQAEAAESRLAQMTADAQIVAGFILQWHPGYEDGIAWGDEDAHDGPGKQNRVYQAAARLNAALAAVPPGEAPTPDATLREGLTTLAEAELKDIREGNR